MNVSTKANRARLVLSPHEPLVAGGSAEAFEQRVQALFRSGYHHLVTDLRGVPDLDSAGIRALVRGHTTAQRLGGSFKLVGPDEHVQTVLKLAHLDSIFEICETVDRAQTQQVPWSVIRLVVGGVLLILALVWGGMDFSILQPAGGVAEFPGAAAQGATPIRPLQPFVEFTKLLAAAAIGILVTAVSRRYRREKPQTQSMEQAQVLLCVSGAMMMIIIGNSLARAFGIAGAASIIRFRTPVEDPRDITILFLLMGLGMATGLGGFALAGMGTMFLCLALMVLDHVGARKPRAMMVEIETKERDLPITHIESVLARNRIVFEPREISQGKESVVRFYTTLDPNLSLEDVSKELMGDGTTGIKSVVWEAPKKND